MIDDMPRFTVTTEGRNDLDLRGLCERYVNGLWIPANLSPDQAAEFAFDYFRRSLLAELKMLVVSPVDSYTLE
jgi:hypothetical protein